MESIFLIFQVVVLVFSAVLHEVAHGFVAEQLGDPTARRMGRLTLNPLKHIDPFGSIILPLLLSLVPGGVVFGWAKPVPYDPRFLKRPERDAALIAAAGPATNLVLAAIFGIAVRVLSAQASLPNSLLYLGDLFSIIVIINVSLAVFNMVPLPPLDGSKVLFGFLPPAAQGMRHALERYGLFILIFFIAAGASYLGPIISALVRLFIGAW
jgi:Zn-dependent protease